MRVTRRRFLQGTAACLAGSAAYWLTRDVIRIGLIGCGVRGQYLAMSVLQTWGDRLAGQIVAMSDVDAPQAEHVRSRYAPFATVHADYRDLLARDDLSAVIIATPDHWHVPMALEAIQAGKAIYCEKPLSLTVHEGQKLRETVAQSQTVFQVGTQQRSHDNFHTACELVRNKRLGQVRKIVVTVPPSRIGGPFPIESVPSDFNWELWQGPAARTSYCPERRRYFRGWYDYSGGTLADWGSHQLDIVHWALDCELAGPVSVQGQAQMPNIPGGYTTPATYSVQYEYPNQVAVHLQTGFKDQGILFEGTRGRIFVNRDRLSGKPVEELKSNPFPEGSIRLGGAAGSGLWGSSVVRHLRNFFHSVRSGEPTASPVAVQHRSATACHIANIALRLGRPLRWDAAHELFVDDVEANRCLAGWNHSIEARSLSPKSGEVVRGPLAN